HLFPVTCGVATHNLATNRLLAALVEDLPSPAMRGAVGATGSEGEEVAIEPDPAGDLVAYVFKTTADPYAGRINLLRLYSGTLRAEHRWAHADPRRGDRRADEGALRRGDRAEAAAGPIPRGDPQAGEGPRPLQEADRGTRAIRRLPHRAPSRLAGRGVRVH